MHTALLILLTKNEKNEPFSHVFDALISSTKVEQASTSYFYFFFSSQKQQSTGHLPSQCGNTKSSPYSYHLYCSVLRYALLSNDDYLRHLKTSVTICEALSMFMHSGRGTRACVCVCVLLPLCLLSEVLGCGVLCAVLLLTYVI
jgi:hypothetical protein